MAKTEDLSIKISANDTASALLLKVSKEIKKLAKDFKDSGDDSAKSGKKHNDSNKSVSDSTKDMSTIVASSMKTNARESLESVKKQTDSHKLLKSSLKEVGSFFKDVASTAAGQLLASSIQSITQKAGQLIDIFNPLSSSSIEHTSNLQQNRIALDVLTGSQEKAKKIMKEIYELDKDAALFNYADIADNTKKLVAMGVATDDVGGIMRNLTTISSGLGKEKLPLLALAFGQVKTAGRLTGAELRQFSENGVPLLEALTDKLNGSAEASRLLTEGTKKAGKAGQEAGAKIKGYSDKLAIAQSNQAQLLQDESAQFDTDYQNRVLKAQIEVDKYNNLIAQTGATIGVNVAKTKYSQAEVQKLISDGKVSYELVKDTMNSMSEAGGKFNGLLEAQSKTYQGRVEQIKNALDGLKLQILGIDKETGDVKAGGLFDTLSNSMQSVLVFLQTNSTKIANMIAWPFTEGMKFARENKTEIKDFLKNGWETLVGGLKDFKDNIYPDLKKKLDEFITWFKSEEGKKAMRETANTFQTIGNTLQFISKMAYEVSKVFTKDFFWWLPILNGATSTVSNNSNTINSLLRTAPSGVKNRAATGEMNSLGGQYMVGERGAEIVNLPKGASVSTARETKAMGSQNSGSTIIINLPQNSYFLSNDNSKNEFVKSILNSLKQNGVSLA
jgi:tape measure domain-containing protein